MAKKKPVKPPGTSKGPPVGGTSGYQFADPQYTADDYSSFSKADRMADSAINVNNPPLQPVPAPRQNPPVLSLSDILPAAALAPYQTSITFHSVGDTGGVKEPSHQFLVADTMVQDFSNSAAVSRPAFFYHLGDVVYYFGQARYYYDQFYDPYRNYAAPIFAIPGNHDGVVYSGEKAASLAAFQKQFCSSAPTHAEEAMGTARSTMTQPGVYFTLQAPFARIIGLYSNTQEGTGAGVISGGVVGQDQKKFLVAQLKQAVQDRGSGKFKGALIIAVHHPPFTGSEDHNPSPDMLADIDDACTQGELPAGRCVFRARPLIREIHALCPEQPDPVRGGRHRRILQPEHV